MLIGATGIGLAPILVRLSQTGPVATAFYRILLAQPILWWALTREEESKPHPRDIWLAALAGFCFAGDLAIWHWSIRLTSVANSTLLTNFAPFFVMIGARFLFGERVTQRLAIGMAIAFAGAFLLVFESLNLDRRFLLGDVLAVVTAVFYSSYLLVVKKLRTARSVAYVMTWSGVFCAPLLLLASVGSGETLLPASPAGWVVLALLAWVSHVGGQGLIAYGLAHIPASVSAVMLMWQPVVAALLAWWILHEPLTPIRAIGGGIIIFGIAVGTWRATK